MTESSCVLVCVTVQKECARLIKLGHMEAQRAHLPLHVVHVSTGKTMLGNPDAAEALNYLFSLAHEVDAEMNILHNHDVLQAISTYARENGAKTLIIGTDRSGFTKSLSMLLPFCNVLTAPE